MSNRNNRKLICIVGPTASGKTGLGVFLAKKLNGEIISADSRQVYRKLDIGTGKEGAQFARSKIKNQKSKIKLKIKNLDNNNSIKIKEIEIENLCEDIRWINEVPQWLIDIVEPEQRFTLFDWLRLARIAIEDIFSRGRVPIVVGGTGLYVQALTEGFQLNQKLKIKNQNDKSKIKKYSREELDKMPIEKLREIYMRLPRFGDSPRLGTDPSAFNFQLSTFNLDINNPRRLIRAIEKAQEGTRTKKIKPDFEVLQIGINLPREELYKKIDKRVDERFKQGMLDEVEGLLESGVDSNWLISLGLEYKIITQYLINSKVKGQKSKFQVKIQKLNAKDNKTNYEQMKQELKFKIHAYARRQLTWFRRFPEIKWVKNINEALKHTQNYLHPTKKMI